MDNRLLSMTTILTRVTDYDRVPITWYHKEDIFEYNRLYYIEEGTGYVTVDGEYFEPTAGQLVLLPANKKVSFGTVGEDTYLKFWCHFDAKIGEQNLFDLVPLPYVVDSYETDRIVSCFRDLVTLILKKDSISTLLVKARLFELLSLYFESARQGGHDDLAPSNYPAQIQQVLKYIDNNLDQHITNKTLADQLHFHPNHFIRYFKSATGLSPMRYISQVRMEKAKHLLLKPNTSITEIGEQLGYNSIYHFSKAFKQYCGYSPSDFRKQY